MVSSISLNMDQPHLAGPEYDLTASLLSPIPTFHHFFKKLAPTRKFAVILGPSHLYFLLFLFHFSHQSPNSASVTVIISCKGCHKHKTLTCLLQSLFYCISSVMMLLQMLWFICRCLKPHVLIGKAFKKRLKWLKWKWNLTLGSGVWLEEVGP